MTTPGTKIHIGTSGWSYEHWKGVFYPDKIATKSMLEAYAGHLRSAEVNSSFYRLPSPKNLALWLKSTPEDFIFSVKASRYITHMKKLRAPEIHLPLLLDRICMLGDRLGPILFQLPPRWHCNQDRFTAFLERLPSGFRYAFEFRDPTWQNSRVYDALLSHNVAFCIYELDGYRSPMEVTADFVYIRLHGPNGPYQGNYEGNILAEWAKFLVASANRGKSVYCYFDNDENGYAAHNALALQDMVAGMLQSSG